MAKVPVRKAIGRDHLGRAIPINSTRREPIAQLEDLRDDCIAVVINSGMSFKTIHARGGPTSQTTSKWLYRETRFPQLATVRALLNACEHDITIAPKGHVRIQRLASDGIHMPLRKSKKRG